VHLAVRPARDEDAGKLAELLNAIIARGGTTALEAPFSPQALAATYLTGPQVITCFVAVDRETGRLLGFQTLVREDHLPQDVGDIGTFARRLYCLQTFQYRSDAIATTFPQKNPAQRPAPSRKPNSYHQPVFGKA